MAGSTVLIKTYFDGCGISPNGVINEEYITLTALTGTEDQWEFFNQEWMKILADKPYYLHVTDALSLRDGFAVEHGWTKPKVIALITECVNFLKDMCAVEAKREGANKIIDLEGLRPSVVRIHIEDFAKAQAEHPDLNSITDVCTFQSIDDCWRWHFYKKGDGFEMYFDQGEPFYGHAVERQRHGRHAKDYRRLTSVLIEEVNMRTCPGIQAADLFTWAVSHAEASAPWPWYRELLAIHRDEQIFHYADLLHPSAETLTKLKRYKFSKRKPLNRKAQEPGS